jgi:hypothetical protein
LIEDAKFESTVLKDSIENDVITNCFKNFRINFFFFSSIKAIYEEINDKVFENDDKSIEAKHKVMVSIEDDMEHLSIILNLIHVCCNK